MTRPRGCDPLHAPAARAGFSIIEAVTVLVIVIMVLGILTPSIITQLSHSRINRAARVVSADFFQAQALAARARQPIRVIVDSTAKTTTLRLLVTDSLLVQRQYGTAGDFKLKIFSASPVEIRVLPNGLTNGSMIVTMGDGTYARQVRISSAGQVRIL